MGSSKAGQSAFSQVDGPPGITGGSALTPHASQIGEASSSVSSHRSLMAHSGGRDSIDVGRAGGSSDCRKPNLDAEHIAKMCKVVDITCDHEVTSSCGSDHYRGVNNVRSPCDCTRSSG